MPKTVKGINIGKGRILKSPANKGGKGGTKNTGKSPFPGDPFRKNLGGS